jgi:hypothetical protein
MKCFSIIPLLVLIPVAACLQTKLASKGVDRYSSEHFGFLAGMWIPTGDLRVLGNHPSVGLQWGLRAREHEFNITLDVRFLKSKIFRPDNAYVVNDYIGGYIGVDYNYYFISAARAEIGFMLGAGYDGFSLPRNKIPSRPYEIDSFNFNAGVRFNVYTNGETYFGLLPRYNFINYRNKGGTSFSGDGISIDLFIGGLWEAGAH